MKDIIFESDYALKFDGLNYVIYQKYSQKSLKNSCFGRESCPTMGMLYSRGIDSQS